jgi:hypothetical protein
VNQPDQLLLVLLLVLLLLVLVLVLLLVLVLVLVLLLLLLLLLPLLLVGLWDFSNLVTTSVIMIRAIITLIISNDRHYW